MYTILIVAVIGIIFIASMCRKEGAGWKETIYVALAMGGFFGAFIGFVLSMLLGGLLTPKNVPYEYAYEYKLTNLRDDTSSKGWFLGSNSYNGKIIYTYYSETEPNKFRGYTVSNHELVWIKEEDNVTPVLKIYNPVYKGTKYKFMSLYKLHGQGYEFVVPKGTVKTTISVGG